LRGDAIAAGQSTISPLARFDANPPPRSTLEIGSYTYLKLTDAADAQRMQGDMPAFLKRHKELRPDTKFELRLTPLADLHFAPGGGDKPHGSMDVIVAAAAIGV